MLHKRNKKHSNVLSSPSLKFNFRDLSETVSNSEDALVSEEIHDDVSVDTGKMPARKSSSNGDTSEPPKFFDPLMRLPVSETTDTEDDESETFAEPTHSVSESTSKASSRIRKPAASKSLWYSKSADTDSEPKADIAPQMAEVKNERLSGFLSHSSISSLTRDIKDRVSQPLQSIKQTLSDTMRERTRSNSENRLTELATYMENSEENELDMGSKKLSPSEPVKGKSTAESPNFEVTGSEMTMSFSTLLAQKQRNQDDSSSLSSNKTVHGEGEAHEGVEMKQQHEVHVSKSKGLESPEEISSMHIISTYVVFLLIYLYLILPIPVLVRSWVFCFAFGFCFANFVLFMLSSTRKKPIVIKPPYINRSVPECIPKSVYDPNQPYKGWMNEIETYDIETYHVASTKSVFVTLEGSTLRLQTPRRNIVRRANFGEGNIPVSNVIHQRIYDIAKAYVYLLPDDLVKKRVWSKKYPICIEFNRSNSGTKPQNDLAQMHNEYDIIDESDLIERVYLFGRTGRQKEEWFYRFQKAISSTTKDEKVKADRSYSFNSSESCGSPEPSITGQEPNSKSSDSDSKRDLYDPALIYRDYFTSICRLLPDPAVYVSVKPDSTEYEPNKSKSNQTVHFSAMASQADTSRKVILSQPKRTPMPDEPGLDVAWLNVMIGRLMFDFLRRPKWADWISNKIQKKLEKIRLPYFIEGLKLTDMDLGTTVPLIHKVSLPRLDSQGVWLDMEITYSGAVQMTLETKMILTKLGKNMVDKPKRDLNLASTNSDEEDSAESSEDESAVSKIVGQVQSSVLPDSAISAPLRYFTSNDNLTPVKLPDRPHPSLGDVAATSSPSASSSSPQQPKRWMRIVDSITKSKYFQRATENSYIKKKLETVSNTPVILTAELMQCQGTLCVNIPPPPSDRIWYGFKERPHMILRAHPKFGERAVTVTKITDWIEKKLIEEFNKVLLIPNMDDIPIPIMFNNLPTK